MGADGKSRSRSLIFFTYSRNNFISVLFGTDRHARFLRNISENEDEVWQMRQHMCACGHVRQCSIFLPDIVSEREKFQPAIETFWPDIVRWPTTISGPVVTYWNIKISLQDWQSDSHARHEQMGYFAKETIAVTAAGHLLSQPGGSLQGLRYLVWNAKGPNGT